MIFTKIIQRCKGRNQAKIMKKTVFFIFVFLTWPREVNMPIDLRKFFNGCAAHLPVKRDIKTVPISYI